MTFRCYHCGAVLDLTNVPAEVVAELKVEGYEFPGLCSSCLPDGGGPPPVIAVRS